MIYLVWCKEKRAGFATTDWSIAYEVRKGGIFNISWIEDADLRNSAYSFCEKYSTLYDCEIIEVNQ